MDETYIKVKGQWKYLCRAVDKKGNTIDFLLTAKRDLKAALRFLKRSIKNSAVSEKINIDKSGSNKAAIQAYNEDFNATIEIRQCKYLNNIIEQDHRFVKQKNFKEDLQQSQPTLNARLYLMSHAQRSFPT